MFHGRESNKGRRNGIIRAPGGPDEDRSGGFSQGVWVAPCFDDDLGKGKHLFAEGAFPARFDLIESGISPKGVIVADYLRAGDVKNGPIEQEVPSESELSRREKLGKEAA